MTTQKPNDFTRAEWERVSLDAISQIKPAESREPIGIGYARVSTPQQDLQLQIDALRALKETVGVNSFVAETASGARGQQRPVRDALLGKLGKGDTLAVWKLDRLGRSVVEVLTIIEQLNARGVRLLSVTESIDTGTSQGRLMITLLSAMSEYERELISERTAAGIAAARARGTHIGRPPVVNREVIRQVATMTAAGQSIPEISRLLKISERSVSTARRIARDETTTYWTDPRYNVTR